MTQPRFTQEVDTYTILTLRLEDYKTSKRQLPAGFKLSGRLDQLRTQEKRLLQELFEDWRVPFSNRLPGFREDSPIFVVQGEQLVGGAFVCDKNEFDADPSRGQLHYAFIDPTFQGMGIYSVIFREAVNRALGWGLQELYLNSDRYMLPEVYLRWGARSWRVVRKPSRLPRNAFGEVLRQIRRRARALGRDERLGG